MRSLLVLTLAFAAAATSSCSGPDEVAEADYPVVVDVAGALRLAQSRDMAWEVGVLEDGSITSGEYEDAYDRYMDCLAELGYVEGVPKYLDPITGTRWYSLQVYAGPEDIDSMADVSYVECDGPLSVIEEPYLAITPEVMDPRLLSRFRECLDIEHIDYRGDEVNFGDFTRDLSDSDFAFGPHYDCLVESMRDIYPQYPFGGVSR